MARKTTNTNTNTNTNTSTIGNTGPAPKGSGRGGARQFMAGKQVRTTPYTAGTTGAQIFAHCAAVGKHLGVPLAPMACVVLACTQAGITPASARAGYSHYKQYHKLAIKAGRATPQQLAAMASYKAPSA